MLVKQEIANSLSSELEEYQSYFSNLKEFKEALLNSISKTDPKFGDYAIKFSFILSPLAKQNPYAIANNLVSLIERNNNFKKVDLVKPAFINVVLSDEFKKKFLLALNKDPLNKINNPAPKKILIEYVSANPTGPLHIGHGRWAILGNVLQNILNFTGNEAKGEFYINDAGNQIKKLRETHEALAKNLPLPENAYDPKYLLQYKDTNDIVSEILSSQKKTLKKLNIDHDYFFSETSLYEGNKISQAMQVLQDLNLAYSKDKALWFLSSQGEDDKDRVLIKSDGSYTYFAVDIAYHQEKINREYDLLIDILGSDHHGYVERISKAVKELSKNKTKLVVLIGQNVFLKNDNQIQKMSKRLGTLVTLDELIEEIPTDVIKYFFSMRSINTPLEFDLKIAKENNLNNPIYYIQYAHARICSVLKKANEQKIIIDINNDITEIDDEVFNISLINKIIVQLMEFKEELITISNNYEIYRLNQYLYSLATSFHQLYNEVNFLRNDHPSTYTKSILLIISLVRKVLARGMKLLSISAKEVM